MGRTAGGPPGSAEDGFDLLLGNLALQRGLVTPEQLREALSDQALQASGGGEVPSLGFFLLARGFLTEERLNALLAEEEARPPSRPRPAPVPSPSSHPASFGKYRIARVLGRGGMGVVYEAHDTRLDRRVALKVMIAHPHSDPRQAAADQERFVREATLNASLPPHPNIVALYEAGTIEGSRYLATQLVEGRPMDEWRRKGPVPLRQQVRLLRDVALAVHHAHEHDIIHRDLKPENVLVDSRGHPFVTDFGLAKTVGQNVELSLTASGMVVGTPAYTSPEQAQGLRNVDRRTDVWSLGVMLYEMLAGRRPFTGETALEILMKVVKNPLASPSSGAPAAAGPARDATLESICLKALSKNPRDRYPTAEEFALDLTKWLQGEDFRVRVVTTTRRRLPAPRPTRAWVYGAAAAAALALVVVLAVLATSAPSAAGDLARGDDHLRRGNPSEALVAYGMALAKDPDNQRARAGQREAEAMLRGAAEDSRLAAERVRREIEEKARAEAAATVESERKRLAQELQALEAQARAADDAARKAQEKLRETSVLSGDEAWEQSIDLLYLVDPSRDAVAGKWTFQDGKLVSDSTQAARIEVPYVPPEEYDLRVGFTRRSGTQSVNAMLSASGRPFLWKMGGSGNTLFAFETIRGARFEANPSTVRASRCLDNGRAHVTVVQVRRDGVRAYLDGRLITQWKTDFSDVSIPAEWKLRDANLLGVGTWEPTAFHKIEIREIAGRGRRSRPGPGEPAARPPAAPPVPSAPLKAAAVDARTLRPGLIGEYYRGTDLRALALRRIDPHVDFQWGSGPLWGGGPSDNVSISWSGYLRVPKAGRYTFSIVSDDGVRLRIGEAAVIDDWTSHTEKESRGGCALHAGFHRLRLDYFDAGEKASVSLSWKEEGSAAFSRIRPDSLFHDPSGLKPVAGALRTVWKALMDHKQRISRDPIPLEKPGVGEGGAVVKDVTESGLAIEFRIGGGTFETTEWPESLPAPVLLELYRRAVPDPAPALRLAMAAVLSDREDFENAWREIDQARAAGANVQEAARALASREASSLENPRTRSPAERAGALRRLLETRGAHLSEDLRKSVKAQIAAAEAPSSPGSQARGLVGHWKLDEGQGTAAADASGHALPGTLRKGASWAPGHLGQALRFDGVDDYVDLGANLGMLRNAAEVTLAAWINLAEGFGPSSVIAFSVGGTSAPSATSRAQLEITADGALRAGARASDTETQKPVDSAPGTVAAGSWTHVACVIRYNANRIVVYRDGVEVASAFPAFARPAAADTDSRNAALGSQDDGSATFFKGRMDDVRIYNRALSPAEVAALARPK
jgi:tRNA A-37 threonylcarbamoyl transferase component Bud32